MRNEAIRFDRLASFDEPSQKDPYAKCGTDSSYGVLVNIRFDYVHPFSDLPLNQVKQLGFSSRRWQRFGFRSRQIVWNAIYHG